MTADLDSELGEARMPIRARPQRETEEPLGLRDANIVDARFAPTHQPVGVEFPLLVSMRAKEVTVRVHVLVNETDGDSMVGEGPNLFDEAVLELDLPLASKEGFDGRTPLEKLGTISPPAVLRVCQGHTRRIATVPGIFGHPGLLRSSFDRKRGKRGTDHFRAFEGSGRQGSDYRFRDETSGKSTSVARAEFT